MESTLLKLTCRDNIIGIRTVARSGKSPHTFYLCMKDKVERLRDGKAVIARDLRSFAELYPEPQTDSLRIRFTWLKYEKDDTLSGTEQEFIVSLAKFSGFIVSEEESASLLTKPRPALPKLDFSQAEETLHRVVSDPVLRHPFRRALKNSFHWIGTKRIEFFPDWEPDSFYFREIRSDGSIGICGGLIRHRYENGENCYAVHT